jgi:tRNA A-37 threonylcarbamoyl transferase component Bud32
MPDSDDSKAAASDALDAVIADYVQQVEAGAVPDRETLLAQHPDLADRLRAFFADYDRLDRQAADLRLSADPNRTTDAALPATELPRVRYFGDYELLEVIARGGMGVVYKARQVSLNRLVALKMILKGELATERDVARFRAEAEAAAHLDHPHIVPIYEVGDHDGQQYYAMRYVEGTSLTRRPRADVRKEAGLVATVARAVHYAHQHGILHRDLKPSNILVDTAGTLLVADFGLAKRVDADRSLTESGALVGTPRYMAPEQAAGRKDLTVAADVYSLGVVLYERLTGQTPFSGETPLEVLRQVQEAEPLRPSSITPGLSRDLETICLKCLEKDPAKRYGSAEVLADDLERWLRGEPIQARPVGQTERLWRWCRRNPMVAAASGLAAAALGAVTIISTLFAIQQSLHADRLGKEQQRTKEALETAERNHREAELHAASLAVDIDLQHCEHGEIENGILGLARTLRTVPPHAVELRQCVEMNLLAWSQELRPLGPSFRHDGAETTWELSPDGLTVLPGGVDGTARLWDAFTGEVRATLRGHRGKINGVEFSQNGRVAMTIGEDWTARLWDVGNGTARAVIDLKPWNWGMKVLSPDGSRLLTIHDPRVVAPSDPKARSRVTLWDTKTGRRVKDLAGHMGRVNSAAFSPDGKRILAGGEDQIARLWSADSGDSLATLQGIMGLVQRVAFSPEGDVAATLEEVHDPQQKLTGYRVRWWDLGRALQIGPPCFTTRTSGEFRCIHRDVALMGSWATLGGSLTPGLFVQGTNESIEIEAHPHTCRADNDYLLGSEGRLLDLRTGKRRAVPAGRRFSEELARFATDGRFFVSDSGLYDGMGVRIRWSLIDLHTEKTIGKFTAWVGGLRHVPDRRSFVSLSWPAPRYLAIADGSLNADFAQLFAEVATCYEFDPAGAIRPLEEAAWEERRAKLAERLREYSAPFLIGRVAADRWHWLRRKLDGAKTDDEKIKYLDRLIAEEPTWQNYDQRARTQRDRWGRQRGQVPRRQIVYEAARDFLEAGKRAGSGYWHQTRAEGTRIEEWVFRLARELTKADKRTPEEMELALQLAEALNGVGEDRGRQFLAIAYYRAGRYAEALPLLPQREWERHCISQCGRLLMSPWSAAYRATEVAVKDESLIEGMAYLAMTYHRLGHPDQARAVLAHVRTLGVWVPPIMGDSYPRKHFDTSAYRYPDLLREAEALIEGKPPPGK